MKKQKSQKPVEIPLKNYWKTKDGETVEYAYPDCIHYYRRDEITKGCNCHTFTIDTPCIEETEGKPCVTCLQWKPGYKSDKIRYIYFKLPENEKMAIEQKMHLPMIGSPVS